MNGEPNTRRWMLAKNSLWRTESKAKVCRSQKVTILDCSWRVTLVCYFRAFYIAWYTFVITVKSIHFLKIILTSCVDQLIIPWCLYSLRASVEIIVTSLPFRYQRMLLLQWVRRLSRKNSVVKTQRRVILKILDVILKCGTEFSGFEPVGLQKWCLKLATGKYKIKGK